MSSKAPKRKIGPWRCAEVPVQYDLDDDLSVVISGGETKTASDKLHHDLAYLRAELVPFKQSQKIIPVILEPDRSGCTFCRRLANVRTLYYQSLLIEQL